jgi:hypothetical protein
MRRAIVLQEDEGEAVDFSKGETLMNRLPKWVLPVLALALIIGLAAPALADEAKGKIKSINQDRNEFVLTDTNAKDWTFHMDESAKIRVNNQDKKLADLKTGDTVTITYTKKGDRLVATDVRCDRK